MELIYQARKDTLLPSPIRIIRRDDNQDILVEEIQHGRVSLITKGNFVDHYTLIEQPKVPTAEDDPKGKDNPDGKPKS